VPRLVYAGAMLEGRSAIATSDCGVSLDDWVESATALQVEAVVSEAKQKLRRLHEAGVLHGDIRTQNITVDLEGKVLFINLSFATDLTDPDASEAREEHLVLEEVCQTLGAK
jgi:tRNA A-37 threonylcarbamoyl transferase component Bud32